MTEEGPETKKFGNGSLGVIAGSVGRRGKGMYLPTWEGPYLPAWEGTLPSRMGRDGPFPCGKDRPFPRGKVHFPSRIILLLSTVGRSFPYRKEINF